MRQRNKPSEGGDGPSSQAPQTKTRSRRQANEQHYSLASYVPLILILIVVVVGVRHFSDRVPSVRNASIPANEFSEERAKNFLIDLMNLGYRPVGSERLEVRSVEYILDTLKNIEYNASCKKTSSCPKVETVLHNADGGSCLKIAGLHIPSKFNNITNILLKIHPRNPSAHSKQAILVNSHFDSALGAFGATDAGALCSVMVEIIRNILNSDAKTLSLDYPLIFMFNGAEEVGLLGAIGFAENHPWAKEIAFVLNMDSAGTGPSALFQHNSDRVLKAYAKSPRPHSSSVGVDLFKSGKFPGDTDYRVFRDSLGGKGADFAYYRNGYMYHTLIDDVIRLQNGSLQHMGDNLLALINELSKSKVLDQPESEDITAFFDIFGVSLILLSNTGVRIGGGLMVIVACMVVLWDRTRVRMNFNLLRLLPALSATVFGVVFGVICAIGNGYLLSKSHPMSWFTHRELVFPLFVVPNIFGQVSAQLIYYKYSLKYSKNSKQIADLIKQNSFSAVLLILAQVLILTIDMGCSFYFLVAISFMLFGKIFELNIGLGPKWTKIIYVICILCPAILFLDFFFSFVPLLIPVMGRVGMAAPVDIVIAVLCSLPVTFIVLLFVPLIHQMPAFSQLLKSLAIIMVVGLVAAQFVHPYGDNTPKRVFLQHSMNYDTGNNEFIAAGWDPVPLKDSFLFDIMTAMHHKGLYIDVGEPQSRGDAFPYNLGYQKIPMYKTVSADPNDWQGTFPYDRRLFGTKYNTIAPEFDGKLIPKPTVSLVSDTVDTKLGWRNITVKINALSTWSNVRIGGPVVAWDIPDEFPVPNAAGFLHARHFTGYGSTSWELSLSLNNTQAKATVRVADVYLKSSSLLQQVSEVLPSWMTPTIVTTAIASFTY